MGAEQIDPLLPQRLVVEVGREVVDDLDDGGGRVQGGEPAGAEVAGHGVPWPAVDVDGEALATRPGLVDEVRVSEVGWVEPPDHQTSARGHASAAATTTGPR
jgi:hypothetical protein